MSADAPTKVFAYGDHRDDGVVHLDFSLPVPQGPAARAAALMLVGKMGLERAEIVHERRLSAAFTHVVVYARCPHWVAVADDDAAEAEEATPRAADVDARIAERFGRALVVVGASIGSDTHTVGIDAILNNKGFGGEKGLEAYRSFTVHNLGSQVPPATLVQHIRRTRADAVLVSQTVTQQDLHVAALTELVDLLEAEGLRDDVLLICGGPRVTPELAQELGFDAGFSRGTTPLDVAAWIARSHGGRDA